MIHTKLNGARACFTQAGPGTDPLRHNLGYHVGDDPQQVTHERHTLARTLGRPIVWMNQTHSTSVRILTLSPPPTTGQSHTLSLSDTPTFDPTLITPTHHIAADGLILDARRAHPSMTAGEEAQASTPKEQSPLPAIGVMTADCLPVLFADYTGLVVAAVHAGRKGLTEGILLRTIERYAELGIPPHQISAIIGPAICGTCYEVPPHMADTISRDLPKVASTTQWNTTGLDLPTAAHHQLTCAGLHSVHNTDACTYEDPTYHSYRRDPHAGRQASIITPAPCARKLSED